MISRVFSERGGDPVIVASGFADIDYSGVPAVAFYWIGAAVLLVAAVSLFLYRRNK